MNHFQGIDPVPERFREFTPLLVPDQSVEKNRMEGIGSHLLITGEDHANDPEKEDVITGHQHVCREKVFQLRRLIRPP